LKEVGICSDSYIALQVFRILSFVLYFEIIDKKQPKDFAKMYFNYYLKGTIPLASHSRKTMQGKLSKEIETLKLFYTDVNLTEYK